ncbi:MAG: mercury(II) reductase [Acidimicrobiales bacterium]
MTDTSSEFEYDLVVIGSGSAAFAAAIKARDGGHRVALIESGTIGGTCVNVGCVPSKALLAAADHYWAAAHHPFAGVTTSAGTVDLGALVAQKDELVASLREHKYADLAVDHGFEVIAGRARFVDADTIDVDGRLIRARVFLVATGASPGVPAIPGLAESGYLTSTTALALTAVPRRLGVIGTGFVGLELGQLFVHLGSEVTFFSRSGRLAPDEEPEVSAVLAEVLVAQGAAIFGPSQITGVDRAVDVRRIRALIDGVEVVSEVDEILVATGRVPNTAGLNLEGAGIAVDGTGAVVVDAGLGTTNPRVWAAGDVTPSPEFVYVAAYEGALATDNALGAAGRTVDYTGLPSVTFTTPQIASAGLTEAEAKAAGFDVKTAILPLSAVPRALVNHDTHGLVKLVADTATDRLLGASMIGGGAGDVIGAAVLVIRHGITTAELAATFQPYLTMVEALKLAAQTFTRDVGRLSCCAA